MKTTKKHNKKNGKRPAMLVGDIKTTISCTVECHFCAETGVVENEAEYGDQLQPMNPHQAAIELYRDGWRIVTSRKYQVSGAVACPTCRKNKEY